jgi:glucose dehydrogenase
MAGIRRFVAAGGCIAALTTGIFTLTAQDRPAAGQFVYMGGDKSLDRYSPLDQISKENVSKLKVAWTRPSLDAEYTRHLPDLTPSNYLRGTPLMVGNMLYVSNGVGFVEAFEPATGKTVWVQKPLPATLREAAGASYRTVDYWTDGKVQRILSVRGEYLYSIDATTGEPASEFGEHGRILLNRNTPDHAKYFGWNGPLVVNDVIVMGGNGGGGPDGGYGDGGLQKEATPEDIRGFDVRSGELLWTFHVLPQPGQPGNETWGKGSWKYSGNMAAYAPLSADAKLGYVYVPLSAPTNDWYGGHRPGNNLYSDSLLALESKTGKLVWHHQLVHHDLWEDDLAAPPVLGDITVNGKRIHAVMQAGKNGFLFVFDRRTGKPVWPIEERPVPASTVPGDAASPTQPFPTKPPAFDRQGFSEADLIDFTPELHAQALAIASHYVMGPMYTPPSMKSTDPNGKQGTLTLPGGWGAGSWNTGAFDPDTGIYYAVSRTEPLINAMLKTDDPKATVEYARGEAHEARPGEHALDDHVIGPEGLPLVKPPYGRITALDLNRGDMLWQVANGDGIRNDPRLQALHLPPLGSPGRPVALVTKTLLFVPESSDAMMGGAGIAGPAKLHAYDKATGKLVWEVDLPVGSTGGPISYLAGGKQYIVVPVGGKSYGAGWIAFALP